MNSISSVNMSLPADLHTTATFEIELSYATYFQMSWWATCSKL